MRNSRILLKEAKGMVSKETWASSVLYPYDPNLPLYKRIPTQIYTKFCLSQISNYFVDFKAREFTATATRIYMEVSASLNKGNRSNLVDYMTHPNVEIAKISQKHGKELPFKIFNDIKTANIVYARISSETEDNSALVNFAHVTVKIDNLDENGQTHSQTVVFERRLDNKLKESWKICFIEDLN
ncbi:hypothetical protein SteCoe_631 [Stentor coeruleus]|uniref:Tim44-like domain-containing protein n=1 Tax=Stentor coeruleus TaxID=5963 RepID=A0A1R2D3X0_9CILI|nr:hypothetical protein SteCoe_631 [Stentor coeruleus]